MTVWLYGLVHTIHSKDDSSNSHSQWISHMHTHVHALVNLPHISYDQATIGEYITESVDSISMDSTDIPYYM